METAPDRGRARIYLDDDLVAVVDTYASTKAHRTIVWVAKVRTGPHTLSVENVGTPGRSRIDVDAVAVS